MPSLLKIVCANIANGRFAVKRRRGVRAATMALTAAVLLGPTAAAARQPSAEAVEVIRPYVHATLPGARVGVVYMDLQNHSNERRYLSAVETTAAANVELHTHAMTDGVMRMRRVHEIALAPGAVTVLRPGGLHIMLIDLARPLPHGGRIRARLTYRDGSVAELDIPVIDSNQAK